MYKFNLPVQYHALTFDERRSVRMQYIDLQKGKCMYCDCDLEGEPPPWITEKGINWGLFPKNFLKYKIHLQHNHSTGFTEGVAHAYCNAVMWQYEQR